MFAELVKWGDVVLENASGRIRSDLGFAFAGLKRLNPEIVYSSISGYASTGPGQNRVTLEPVIKAAGLTATMQYRNSGPYRSGVAWADPMAGLSAVAGTLVGLWDRAAERGVVQLMESAMPESMASSVGGELLALQVRGTNAPQLGNRDVTFARQGVYRCAGQDCWAAISITNDADWQGLCAVARLEPALAELGVAERYKHHDAVDGAIQDWTRAQSPWGAMACLQALGVIAAPVSDGRDLAENPHLDARYFWAVTSHADAGRRRYPGNPIKLSGTSGIYRNPLPGLGQHNDHLYPGMLGLPAEEVADLRPSHVLAEVPPATPAELATLGPNGNERRRSRN